MSLREAFNLEIQMFWPPQTEHIVCFSVFCGAEGRALFVETSIDQDLIHFGGDETRPGRGSSWLLILFPYWDSTYTGDRLTWEGDHMNKLPFLHKWFYYMNTCKPEATITWNYTIRSETPIPIHAIPTNPWQVLLYTSRQSTTFRNWRLTLSSIHPNLRVWGPKYMAA